MREGTRDSEYNSYICLDIVMAFYKKKKERKKSYYIKYMYLYKEASQFQGEKSGTRTEKTQYCQSQ